MSKTLFWYIFRDLVRIFFLAGGTLAGIMSFGGLMRPLTENGLAAWQVGKMLTDLMPAMLAYSLPAAALFATTVAYGRLAADNELTACRAAGMSYWSIGFPAVVLGLLVAILSLFLLCFVVPVYSLKVEEVLFANLGQVVVNKITRDHEVRPGYDRPMIYAERASLLPADEFHPEDQLVQLVGPTIVTYEDKPGTDLRVPKDFFTAAYAILRIHPTLDQGADQQVEVDFSLQGGAKFPREFGGADRNQIGVDSVAPQQYFVANPIKQNVKFMTLPKLLELAADPSTSQRITDVIADVRRRDEEETYLQSLAGTPTGQACVIQTSTSPPHEYAMVSDGPAPTMTDGRLTFASQAGKRQVRLTVTQEGRISRTANANAAVLRAHADDEHGVISVSLELRDVSMQVMDSGMGTTPAELPVWDVTLDVPMSQTAAAERHNRTVADYLGDTSLNADDANSLRRQQIVVNNEVRSELNGRASFAVSCLILVLVGCSLGMMFKSGNFLTAFAVSFAPALLCIALVVAGQQTADHIPLEVGTRFMEHNRPLQLGVVLIWSGNVIVLGMAAGLVARLRRR